VLATGGVGKCYKVTSNSWEYTGDGHSLAYWAGADLMDMEFVQFHPTGMVWPPSVRGILVTEGVRGEGGVLLNNKGERFMFDYIPDYYRAETAETAEEADRWYTDKRNNRRPPELLPRDVVARAINTEIKAGRGSPHGGVYLDIATRMGREQILRKLPGMYEQFLRLADVDITREPMEVGPTMHYIMGGVRVDAETAASTVPGLYAAGEVAAGLHGANRLGGNSLSDLLVFGRRAGLYAARYAASLVQLPSISGDEVEEIATEMYAPFHCPDGENPFAIQKELQETMQDLVGIVRTGDELQEALRRIQALKERAQRVSVPGNQQYNPGWHLALDLRPLLTVAEAIALSALERKESRGAHTREDYPDEDPQQARFNLVVRRDSDGQPLLERVERPELPEEVRKILQEA
jgi:succinate dehydrogenase / fumarate reductase flavoprotein subunit